MRTISHLQIVGYLLWRGGLLLAGAGALYAASNWLLGLWLLPAAVTGGAALVITGLGLVMLSLVLERRADELEEQQ